MPMTMTMPMPMPMPMPRPHPEVSSAIAMIVAEVFPASMPITIQYMNAHSETSIEMQNFLVAKTVNVYSGDVGIVAEGAACQPETAILPLYRSLARIIMGPEEDLIAKDTGQQAHILIVGTDEAHVRSLRWTN